MPKVKAFWIPGIECFFYSHDHDPPHFHAMKAGEWELKIAFEEGRNTMFTLVFGKKPKRSVLKMLFEEVVANRDSLRDQWMNEVQP